MKTPFFSPHAPYPETRNYLSWNVIFVVCTKIILRNFLCSYESIKSRRRRISYTHRADYKFNKTFVASVWFSFSHVTKMHGQWHVKYTRQTHNN